MRNDIARARARESLEGGGESGANEREYGLSMSTEYAHYMETINNIDKSLGRSTIDMSVSADCDRDAISRFILTNDFRFECAVPIAFPMK